MSMFNMRNKFKNVHLTEITPYKCDDDGKFYMRLTYSADASDGNYAIIYPKVGFPISQNDLPRFCQEDRMFCNDLNYISLNTSDTTPIFNIDAITVMTYKGEVVTLKDVDYVVVKVTDRPPVEMTLDEIEKELGHRVKIVNEKGEKNDYGQREIH